MNGTNYIIAPVAVADRIGLAGMRMTAGEGYVILTESDMRMVDLTIEEKIEFFGCEVITEAEAEMLIAEDSNEASDNPEALTQEEESYE